MSPFTAAPQPRPGGETAAVAAAAADAAATANEDDAAAAAAAAAPSLPPAPPLAGGGGGGGGVTLGLPSASAMASDAPPRSRSSRARRRHPARGYRFVAKRRGPDAPHHMENAHLKAPSALSTVGAVTCASAAAAGRRPRDAATRGALWRDIASSRESTTRAAPATPPARAPPKRAVKND